VGRDRDLVRAGLVLESRSRSASPPGDGPVPFLRRSCPDVPFRAFSRSPSGEGASPTRVFSATSYGWAASLPDRPRSDAKMKSFGRRNAALPPAGDSRPVRRERERQASRPFSPSALRAPAFPKRYTGILARRPVIAPFRRGGFSRRKTWSRGSARTTAVAPSTPPPVVTEDGFLGAV